MARKPEKKFRIGQLVMVINDGVIETLQPDFIIDVDEWTKKHGWSYFVRGCSHPLAECQMRRIKKREIK